MFNAKKRKEARLSSDIHDQISIVVYNLILGAMILYGFVANAIMVLLAQNFMIDLIESISWIGFLIGYFVCAIAGSIIAVKSHKPFWSFVGYNLIVVPIGALLTLCLPAYDPANILLAIVLTGIVTAAMMALSAAFPRFFSKLGWALLIALLIGIVVEIVAILLGYRGDLFNWLFVLLFSLYIGYDWNRAQAYPKTVDNAIDSAIDLYLDLINVFIRILDILERK